MACSFRGHIGAHGVGVTGSPAAHLVKGRWIAEQEHIESSWVVEEWKSAELGKRETVRVRTRDRNRNGEGSGDGLMRGQRMLLAGRSSPPGIGGNGTPAQTVGGILMQQARGLPRETYRQSCTRNSGR